MDSFKKKLMFDSDKLDSLISTMNEVEIFLARASSSEGDQSLQKEAKLLLSKLISFREKTQ